jgi:hypothetical protein
LEHLVVTQHREEGAIITNDSSPDPNGPSQMAALRPGFFISQPMKLQAFVWSCVLLSAAFQSGCEENDLAPFDVRGTPPTFASVTVGPTAVNIDTLTPVNGVYSVATVVTAIASSSDGITVVAEILRPSATSPFHQTLLHDDGLAPDQTAGDGIFSATLPFGLTRPQAGRYRIRIFAQDSQGRLSSISELAYFALRNNSAPVLSNLAAPDTLTRPQAGSLLFSMSVAASDSDGLADITEVFFRNLDSPSQNKIFLWDDGGVTHGDPVAGDGTFSVVVQLPDTVSPRTFQFLFQAADTFGDTSASLPHFLTVR